MLALGIDIGSSTTKVVLVEIDGGHLCEVASSASVTPGDVPGLVDVIARRCRQLVGPGITVAAVGVASMAETGAAIGADGEALTDLLRWDAGLGAEDAAAMADLAPAVFARSGVRLSAKTPLTTWRWLARERPEVWARMACWLSVADVVAHALTGERVTDHTLAGRTGGYRLAAPGEPPTSVFDGELLALAGLEPTRLPRVAGPYESAGRVTAAAAARTGLTEGVPVVVAGHDHQVASWAAGMREPGDVADSLGTAEAVLSVVGERPVLEDVRRQGMSLVRSVGGVHDALLAGTSSAGAMLQHWLSTIPEDHREDVLTRAASSLAEAPGPTGAAVEPYLRGRQTPRPDPHARPGNPPAHWSWEEQARAVVEGICYQARWMIESQGDPRRVAVIGGGRLPELWTALKRASLPWPISLVRAGEPVATGAALLALVRSGHLGDPAVAIRTAPTLDVVPQPMPVGDPHGRSYAAFLARIGA
ncbi:FGGY-family carbohydrate kinase [Pseudactinotalea terrae]|uniref:FGGY-family carbohydrate kinase n=1 Tax=Pseudactinotalea terrae TaxID=1743262 RepID=UPI0012E0EF8E|nr:FGGY family carbohydrate kinase [Pseudactinotalea terrae]